MVGHVVELEAPLVCMGSDALHSVDFVGTDASALGIPSAGVRRLAV